MKEINATKWEIAVFDEQNKVSIEHLEHYDKRNSAHYFIFLFEREKAEEAQKGFQEAEHRKRLKELYERILGVREVIK